MYKITVNYGIPSRGIAEDMDIYTDKSLGFIEDHLKDIVIERVLEKHGLMASEENVRWNNIIKVEKIDGVIK
jgi:hypothetical protein